MLEPLPNQSTGSHTYSLFLSSSRQCPRASLLCNIGQEWRTLISWLTLSWENNLSFLQFHRGEPSDLKFDICDSESIHMVMPNNEIHIKNREYILKADNLSFTELPWTPSETIYQQSNMFPAIKFSVGSHESNCRKRERVVALSKFQRWGGYVGT